MDTYECFSVSARSVSWIACKFHVQYLNQQLYLTTSGLFSSHLALKVFSVQRSLYCFYRDFLKKFIFSSANTPLTTLSPRIIKWSGFSFWGAVKTWWWVAVESSALKDDCWEHVLGPRAWLPWWFWGSAKAVSHCGWKEAPLPATMWDSGSWREGWNDALLPQMGGLRVFF